MFLGIDLGTSNCTAVLFDADGREHASAGVGHALERHSAGRAEADPERWWEVTAEAVNAVVDSRGTDPSAIEAVGITGLATGYVPLDASGEPVGSVILSFLDERIGESPLDRDDLTFLQESLYATLRWLRRHCPAVYERTDSVVDAREYLGYRLTGQLRRDGFWFPDDLTAELNAAHDVSPDLLPPTHTYVDPIGPVSPELARKFGLGESVPVVVGPWDGLCNAFGSGLNEPGRTMIVSGTTCIVATCTAPGDGAANTAYPVEGCGLHYATDLTGLGNRWFRECLLEPVTDDISFERIDRMVEAVETEDSPVFVPTVDGSMAHGDMRGGLVGLTADHTVEHVAKAVYESEAYFLREVLTEVGGASTGPVRASGGGAQSEVWNRIRADATGRPVERLQTTETAALGAAILGSVANGRFDRITDAMDGMVTATDSVEPRDDPGADYARNYETYTRLYDLLVDRYAA